MSCFGSLGEGPIHFYSNGIISHSKIFRRGYLRKKIAFFFSSFFVSREKGGKKWRQVEEEM